MKMTALNQRTRAWTLALSATISLGASGAALAQDKFPVAGQNGMQGYAMQPNGMQPNTMQGNGAPMQPNMGPTAFPSQGGGNIGQSSAPMGAVGMPNQGAPTAPVGAYNPALMNNPQGGPMQAPMQGGTMQAPGAVAGPNGGFQMPPNGSPPGGSAQPGSGAGLSALARQELQDFGVPPTSQLHAGAMHGPTPAQIPGGKVTTTEQLSAALQSNQGQLLLFHVLGGRETLPNAQFAMPASAPGNFNDQTQQAFTQYLGQVTKGQKGQPMVFYCASPQCWMSYNAALRAINGGYTNVIWYRGGIEAWKAAGLPTAMQ